jgi:hypothetical protein
MSQWKVYHSLIDFAVRNINSKLLVMKIHLSILIKMIILNNQFSFFSRMKTMQHMNNNRSITLNKDTHCQSKWLYKFMSMVYRISEELIFILISIDPVFDISRRLNAACMLKCRYNKYQFYSLWTKQGLKPTGQVNQYTTCWL